MAESAAFEHLCSLLEADTALDRLESRGTVRILLKKAGLTPRDVESKQLAFVVGKLLREELDARGVDGADEICERAAIALRMLNEEVRDNNPSSVFERMVAD